MAPDSGRRGIVRVARRPEGWSPPGPSPVGACGRPELEPDVDEDLCYLSGDWRLFQKLRGHRWSLDDLVTAWVATRGHTTDTPVRALDLGCGLGSVLLMVAWKLPRADVTGIEAQVDRAALGRRSIAYNGVVDRCRIVDGDLRELALAGEFDLITGTPPYFPRGTGCESEKPHAAACRFELRGGVEAYLATAVSRLASAGTFTMCSSARERDRVSAAIRVEGLAHREHWEVVPRIGKPSLIAIDVVGRPTAQVPPTSTHTLVVRDEKGAWTPEFRKVRDDFGMPSKIANTATP
jgi:tRNA1Val (adenine37-N6)-methyltransferase